MASPSVPNPIKDELSNCKDALNSVEELHTAAVEALESGPKTSEPGGALDEQVLLLKATSQATVNILQQCYSILQHQVFQFAKLSRSKSQFPALFPFSLYL